jgi:outer membrane protein TolC
MIKTIARGAALMVVSTVLTACTTTSTTSVAPALASASGRADADIDTAVRTRLAEPIGIDEAVRIALLNNRGLRARYLQANEPETRIVEAARAAQGTPVNGAGASHPLDAERRFIVAMTAPLAQRFGSEVDRRKGDRARLEIVGEMLQVAGATRKAYIAAVSADESARYLARAAASTEAATELARRMVRVGNWPKLNELRERAFHGEVATQLAKARQMAVAERERLTRLLGLWGSDAEYRLPERLPDLPASAAEMANVEETAVRQRTDLQALRLGVFAEAREFELDGYDRGELFPYRTGIVTLSENDYFADEPEKVQRDVQVPVFDRRRAWADLKLRPYVAELDRYTQTAIEVRSEAREAYHGYRTAYDVARHYRDVILPLRREISEENQLRYNGMLISVFELLGDARDQITSVMSYIEAQREFWIAETDLRLALTVGGAGGTNDRAARLPGGSTAAGH